MNIRKATLHELPEIMAIFDRAKRFMRENGNPRQWRDYPPEELLRQDIAAGDCYVMESGDGIEAVFVMQAGSDEEYEPYSTGGDYLSLHRLASAGRRKGAFRAMLDFARAHGDHLMGDTHEDNHIMQGLLTGGGFRFRGELRRFGERFFVYEWRRSEQENEGERR